MVRVEVVAARLGELAHRIERIRARTPASVEALKEDEDTLDLLSFNLMLAVQCCVDVASHLIADEGWRPALTLGESFDRLREQGVLTAATASALRSGAG